jgi:hypothetical protein
VPEAADVADPDAGDVEVVAQPRLGLQPVLVERVEPVQLAVPMGEVAERAHQLLVAVHVVDAEVLGQRVAQLAPQVVVRSVADPEHVRPRLLQPDAEVEPVRREMRREKDDVHAAAECYWPESSATSGAIASIEPAGHM